MFIAAQLRSRAKWWGSCEVSSPSVRKPKGLSNIKYINNEHVHILHYLTSGIYYLTISVILDGASLMAQMVKNPPAMLETCARSLGREPSWRRKWLPTPVFLPGESLDRGAWQATVHAVAKSRTRLKRLCTHARVILDKLPVTLI